MGKVLGGRFELLAEAARGGMGSVHRGRDARTGQTVAIKVLELTGAFDLIRFQREAEVLATVDHPNVVRYVAHGESDGVHYLVQEWVDGITLSTQLVTLGLSPRDAIKVAIGVADALGAAHELGVVHRDVKPGNIILDAGDPERVKLVDFGIARAQADAGVLTRTGVLVGTPHYMAPEQARGSAEVPPAADVWALGCVLYEAISGRRAFGGRTPEAIRAKALLYEPERLDAIAPEVAQPIVQLVHEMLSKQHQMRPQSGNELARALRAVLPLAVDAPIRRLGKVDQRATAIVPRKGHRGANSFVLVSAAPAEASAGGPPPPSTEVLQRISDRHNLKLHALEDGSLLLVARDLDHEGAKSAAYAAIEIQSQAWDGAVSVFAQAYQEPLDQAIDRGAESLAAVTMASLFAEAVGAEPIIPVDDVIAYLLRTEEDAELTLVMTETGQALRPQKKTG